ncbi:IgGFc-binding protein-like isoform X1 [Acipenser ruthenus]|uniref:IgGFc-binding protein-like isoform X1 n=1 Tax=Acipenser ruthenus TaxID=7906 RepID=UPI00274212A2|nr:IgGFc-binding protein-like isoform X1 [Acipenser ruthenus]
MWRTLLLICVFSVLSGAGFCSASPAGKEFVNVFLQNNDPSSDSRLELMITSYSASTLVTVQVYQSSFRKEFTLFSGQSRSVELPGNVEMRGNTYSSNACIVQADQEVSVLAVSCKSRACVTSLLYPVGYWGNRYYAITPQVPQQETYRQIGITNHKYKNAIEIFLTSQVTFQGTLYSKGDVVKITLSEFQSVQLQGANSLSGTEIRTTDSVGVMCGFTCSPQNTVKCHYGFQQLIPAPSWGLSYVVPPLASRSGSDLVYVVAFQNTRINIQYNKALQLKDVLGGTVAQFQVDPSSPMYITASQGVQVIYFCTGSVPGALPAVAPFMMGIADTGTYCFNYNFTAMPSFQNSAVMVAKGANGILIALDQKPLPPDVRWSPVKESDYSWAVMGIANPGDHNLWQQGGIFGLYIVGTASESSYGYPAVCTEQTMNCPENSHYESCGSACPATCSDPKASFNCIFLCVESCQCNTGYLWSGSLCVPAQQCGCTYQGHYYLPNETFWADKSCTQQCTCDLYTSRVTCKQSSCKLSEECRLVDEVWGCYPSVNSFKTCSAEGDPHYITFDGCRYDFQGTCIYQLVALCSYNTNLTPFEVHVQNDNRESTVVSYSKMVRVKVYGITIEISKDSSGKVQVDGILINLPYSFSNGKVKIYRIGMNAVVRTDFGLRLTFDWSSRVTVTVSAAYSGSLCGLCGNYNGDPADDLIGKNGQTVLSPDAFGERWKTGDVPGCVDRCQGSCPVCSDKEKLAYAGSGFCGRITDPRGPFRDCLGVVDSKRFFENCVYDVCIYKGLQSILCQSIASYVATCQEVGANIYPWRSKGFCDMPCPANSNYELCSTAFPRTCIESPVPLDAPCMEGCRCATGFVLSGVNCVPSSECGCLHNNVYYQPGESFFPESLCQQRCTCGSNGQIRCLPFTCAKGEKCSVENGVRKCIPVMVSGKCSASGDPHYRSFDGRAFDFQGTCTYTLAVSCPKSGAMGSVEPFSVHMQNEKWGRGTVAVTKLVELGIYGSNFTLTQGLSGKVKVDGIMWNIPAVLDRVSVTQHGLNVLIQTEAGVEVVYDLLYCVVVTVPQTYMGQMCGLCGNYNGNPGDDFQLADGSQTTDVQALGSSWKVFVPGADCNDGCGNDCPLCDRSGKSLFGAAGYCGMITAPTGPFSSCFPVVDPQGYFNDCVYDLCLSDGGTKQVCHSLQAYTAACQVAGVQIQPWRNDYFCPMACPANSQYKLCASTCAMSCAGITGKMTCMLTCAEGCECNAGYRLDGDRCVEANGCGCFEKGRYYKAGEVVWEQMCSRKCSCSPSTGLQCMEASCPRSLVCRVQDGIMGCFKPDDGPLPCDRIDCPPNTKCQVINLQPTCVADSTSCWVLGGPHYHTFDGMNFDFHGNCTYTLAQKCGNQINVPQFSVQVQNEHLGSRLLSSIKTVYVVVSGDTITVVRQELGFVRVNGVRRYLPFSLQLGKIKLYQSGALLVVEMDFGVSVMYNWNGYLVIKLARSFTERVCGMCGNNNGDSTDDFVTPSGSRVKNEMDFGWSWKVDNADRFCQADCNGPCPVCYPRMAQQYKMDGSCELLTQSSGPFAVCQALIDPSIYQQNCMYDLCVNNGNQTLLCQALEAYADACQRAGIKLQEWREMAVCPIYCPDDGHYESCGSACPATCSVPEASSRCLLPCVETCQCNAGYLRSGSLCVPAQRCGCTYQGYYYLPNEKFWADERCTQQCTCDLYTSRVTCKQASCKPSEECRLVDGVWGCYPSVNSFKTCSAEGDPHYITFDGCRYDFQGTCIYQLVALCSYNPSLTPFEVHVQNDNRESTVVSYSKMVRVKVYGITIEISKDNSGKVQVDGILINLPYSFSNGKVKVYRIGMNAVVRTDFGLRLTFDWSSRVTVTVSAAYSGSLCGLCGNYNGDPADDLIGKNGQTVLSPDAFGERWKTGDVPGCVDRCQGSCPVCSDKEKLAYAGSGFCGRITDPRGPFRDCLGVVDPKRFFENCVYDVCIYKGLQSILCQSIASFVATCQEVGANIYPWRSKGFCDMPCPANSNYELCSTAFPRTCIESPVPLDAPCMEGCRCATGFVLSGVNCVPSSECGCLHNNVYYQPGESFFPESLCQQRCTCGSNGQIKCLPFTCAKGEKCGVENGVRKCIPVMVSGKCSASGDPHYYSFDGRAFDFQGTCAYTLAVSCPKSGAMGSVEPFSVRVQNEKWGSGTVAVTKLVELGIYGSNFTLTQGLSGKVKVDGIMWNIPAVLDRVSVTQHGLNVLIQTEAGVEVVYDLLYCVVVTVPQTYMGQMCGLCGNYNGNPGDDFQLADGSQTTDVQALGSSWKVFVPGADCDDGCGNDCPLCDRSGKSLFGAAGYCGMITAPTGPFSSCFPVVDPQGYFNDCVYDLCLSDGGTKQLCHSLQAYTAACQVAGVQIQPWRNDYFCPMACPANSQYKLCASTCAMSCAGITGKMTCMLTCAEGCECNAGYRLDGDRCVEANSCGCFEKGRYYKAGEVVWEQMCSRKCSCSPSTGLQCMEASCPKSLVCRVQDGIMGCFKPDDGPLPCDRIDCPPNTKCQVINLQPTCVADSTSCWVLGGPHYHTFDGMNFDFHGNCTYTLAQKCGNQINVPQFSVQVQNEHLGSRLLSSIKTVYVAVSGDTITVVRQELGFVWVRRV